jgi:hypothetical protein
MADEIGNGGFERIVDALLAHGVEFICIGGAAEELYRGSACARDVEIRYRQTP